MKENKELKDLLTTGVIVEICNVTEKDTIKYIGVVVGDIILYDDGYDPVHLLIEYTESKNSEYYIDKIYSPNKKCLKLKDLIDNSNSEVIWERNNKPNRLTREDFAELPLGTRIVGVNKDNNMEELEFIKIKDYYSDNAILRLLDYKTLNFYEFGSIPFYLKEEYEEYKKRVDK